MEKGPRPVYPFWVWDGTPYGVFGELCAEGNYVPKKLFIESLRTVVGAIVGDRLSTDVHGAHPRSFTIIIAPPGSGKGTSNTYVSQLFDVAWDSLARSGETPLIWRKPSDFAWRHRGIGAQVVTPASAPGLLMAITPRKLKANETPNPMETWDPKPRIITVAEEVRALLSNFANESTGAGLESVLCELYDSETFTATATKDRAPASGELQYSLLGGITPEGFNGVFARVESTSSGFLSRLNIVGTEEKRTVGGLSNPDLTTVRDALFPMLADLEDHPKHIPAGPESRAWMNEWFQAVVAPEGIGKARLNIHAWRVALHLAWLKGHTRIELEDVKGGILCAEYLAKMREWYQPPEGETRAARAEAAIRKVMRSRRHCGLRDLKRATNSRTISVGDWDKALGALVHAGELRIAEERSGKGQMVKTVILLKEED